MSASPYACGYTVAVTIWSRIQCIRRSLTWMKQQNSQSVTLCRYHTLTHFSDRCSDCGGIWLACVPNIVSSHRMRVADLFVCGMSHRPSQCVSISHVVFENVVATHVTGRPPSFRQNTNFTATVDGQGLDQNVSTEHPVRHFHVTNMSIVYQGGGVSADASAKASAVPYHNPNDGGPRSSGKRCAGGHTECADLGLRPSYGLFLRQLRDSTFRGVSLSFERNDDRPACVLIDCTNVSFAGTLHFRQVGSS